VDFLVRSFYRNPRTRAQHEQYGATTNAPMASHHAAMIIWTPVVTAVPSRVIRPI
jgi:hypothetical protein